MVFGIRATSFILANGLSLKQLFNATTSTVYTLSNGTTATKRRVRQKGLKIAKKLTNVM
jgi:hypothetical protein